MVEKARIACFNRGQRAEGHFLEINEMIQIGKGGPRSVKTVMLSRYAGHPVIQPKRSVPLMVRIYGSG